MRAGISRGWLVRFSSVVASIVAYYVLHLVFGWSANPALAAMTGILIGGQVITLIPGWKEAWRESLQRAAERATKDPRFPRK